MKPVYSKYSADQFLRKREYKKRQPRSPKMTNFYKATIDFEATDEYKTLVDALIKNGIKEPYCRNIVFRAFAAGFIASGVKIEIIQQQTQTP